MTKLKTNPFEVLNKKSFDKFLVVIKKFNYSYLNTDNRDIYLKGKKQLNDINLIITNNKDFFKIFNIWEQYLVDYNKTKNSSSLVDKQFLELRETLN